MAFNLQFLQNFSGSGKGPKLWGYSSSTDAANAIVAPGYFNSAAGLVHVGDRLFCQASDGQVDLTVLTVSAGEVATRGPGLQVASTWNPEAILDGDKASFVVTVPGASIGDFVLSSFSQDVADLVLDAQVTAADTVTAVLANNTGVTVDLASGTLRLRVLK